MPRMMPFLALLTLATLAFLGNAVALPPAAPENLALAPGVAQIELSWDPPLDDGGAAISAYHIYRGADAGSLVLLDSTAGATTYTDTGLGNGETWFYAVSAENVDGEGPQTAAQSATTHDLPDAPLNLALTPDVAEIALSWDAPASDGGSAITAYHIYRGADAGSLAFHDSTAGTTTYTDTGLGNGETWFYAVSAENAVGEGAQTAAQSATTFNLPSAPVNLSAASGSGNITLSWEAPADDGGSAVTGYEIYGADEAAGPFTLLGSTGAAELSYVEEGLGAGMTRHYRVNATNAGGEGPSTSVSGQTNAPSGGGGGGPPPSAEDGPIDCYALWCTVRTDTSGMAPLVFHNVPGFDTIHLTLATEAEVTVTAEITRLYVLPSEVPAPPVAQDPPLWLSLKATGGEATRIAELRFNVLADSLGEADPQRLVLLEFEAGGWHAHALTYEGADDGVHRYSSMLDGFSIVTFVADLEPPEVAFSPPSGPVLGPTTLEAQTNDMLGILRVEFYAGSVLLGTAESSPYVLEWDPAGSPAGEHVLRVVAVDLAGNTAESSARATYIPSSSDSTRTTQDAQEDDDAGTTEAPYLSVLIPIVGLALFLALRRRSP
jgi:hypothetical protein